MRDWALCFIVSVSWLNYLHGRGLKLNKTKIQNFSHWIVAANSVIKRNRFVIFKNPYLTCDFPIFSINIFWISFIPYILSLLKSPSFFKIWLNCHLCFEAFPGLQGELNSPKYELQWYLFCAYFLIVITYHFIF